MAKLSENGEMAFSQRSWRRSSKSGLFKASKGGEGVQQRIGTS